MIWTYPIFHFLEKHWYDSFLHLYQRAPCKRFWFLIKFRATYLCSITLFMAIPGYFKMHIAWIIYLLFLICRYPFIHQPFNELY